MSNAKPNFCNHCGTELTEDAAYCHSCGRPIYKPTDAQAEKVSSPSATQATAPLETTPSLQHKSKSWWATPILILCLIALVGISASIILGPNDPKQLQSLVFGCIITGVILAKKKGASGWIGALIGIAAAVFLGIVLSVVRPILFPIDYVVERSPEFLALKQFDPATYEKVKAKLKTLPRSTSSEMAITQTLPLMMEVLPKALRQTSDDATLQYAKDLTEGYAEMAKVTTPEECAAFFTGKTTPGMDAHLAAKVASRRQQTEAFSRILTDAVQRPNPYKPDSARFRALYIQIDVAMRAEGGAGPETVFADPPVLPPALLCNGRVEFFRQVMLLPPSDRSFFLRAFILG
jgi:hypothetical protein